MSATITDVRLGPAVDLSHRAEYQVLPSATHRLVSTSIHMTCCGMAPGARAFSVPKSALPFGVFEGLQLEGLPAKASLGATVRVVKATGMVDMVLKGPKWYGGVGIGSCIELATPQDAADEDLARVKAATGHVMAWRMIAAGTIGDITITLNPGVHMPTELRVVFFGANAIDAGCALPHAAGSKPPALLLPPLTPKARLTRLRGDNPALAPPPAAAGSGEGVAETAAAAAPAAPAPAPAAAPMGADDATSSSTVSATVTSPLLGSQVEHGGGHAPGPDA
jgi:hypothetical protein